MITGKAIFQNISYFLLLYLSFKCFSWSHVTSIIMFVNYFLYWQKLLDWFPQACEEQKAKARHELDEKLKQKVKEERKKVFLIFTDVVQLYLENRSTAYFATLSPCTALARGVHSNKSIRYAFSMLDSSVLNYRRDHFAVFWKFSTWSI